MDVYEVITKTITDKLEAGCIPWRKPWDCEESAPRNFVSTKAYRGLNHFMLSLIGDCYSSPFWLTYNQAKSLGGFVKPGEKSPMFVCFYKPQHTGTTTNEETGEEETRTYNVLRYTPVFNTDQCEGLKVPKMERPERGIREKIAAAEALVKSYKSKPEIEIKESRRAFYAPSKDKVTVPQMSQYANVEEYYSTLFHELGHSTGHESRLDRDLKNFFGSHEYSKEELVAELTASYLCGIAGIERATLDNSSAYIAGWLSKLKDKENRKWLPWAAGQAAKAGDMIRGIEPAKSEEKIAA